MDMKGFLLDLKEKGINISVEEGKIRTRARKD